MTDERFFDMLAVKYPNRMPEPVIEPRKNINALRPGPRIPEGRAASSRNSLTHGPTARTTVIPGEDQAEFDALCQSLIEDRNPKANSKFSSPAKSPRPAGAWPAPASTKLTSSKSPWNCTPAERPKKLLVMRYAGAIERQLNCTIVRLHDEGR